MWSYVRELGEMAYHVMNSSPQFCDLPTGNVAQGMDNDSVFCASTVIRITDSKRVSLLLRVSDLETVDKIVSGKQFINHKLQAMFSTCFI